MLAPRARQLEQVPPRDRVGHNWRSFQTIWISWISTIFHGPQLWDLNRLVHDLPFHWCWSQALDSGSSLSLACFFFTIGCRCHSSTAYCLHCHSVKLCSLSPRVRGTKERHLICRVHFLSTVFLRSFTKSISLKDLCFPDFSTCLTLLTGGGPYQARRPELSPFWRLSVLSFFCPEEFVPRLDTSAVFSMPLFP